MTKKYTIIIIIVLLAVAVFGALLVWHWVWDVSPEDMAGAVLEANTCDAAGVQLTSAFTLSFDDAVSSTAVRRCLQVQPDIEVGVHQGTSRQQVLVVPAEPLMPDTLYTFVLSDGGLAKSWVFQTGNQVAVTDFSPADRSTEVRGSSISFTLDRLLEADLEAIDGYFVIEPQVEGSFSQSGRILTFNAAEGFAPGTVYQVSLKAGLPFRDTASTLAADLSFAFETQGVDSSWCLSGPTVCLSGEQPRFTLRSADGSASRGGFSAQLFALSEDAYAALWEQLLQQQPAWSRGFAALSGCSFNGSLLDEFTVSPEAGGFELPQQLDAGCYLLRVSRGGSSHDLPFAVSTLSAAVLNHGADLLTWVHEAKSGQRAAKAEVRDLLSGQLMLADNQGVAQLTGVGENALLRITVGDERLLLPCWQGSEQTAGPLLWRYLYLSQERYAVGDTLRFWGLVQPRDGSLLEYEAVTVYLFDRDDRPVLSQYTPLADYFFSGELELPALPDGSYRLAVWQSGRELLSRSFALGAAEAETPSRSETATIAPQLPLRAAMSLDAELYRRGESFAASCSGEAEDYLFLTASQAGVSWAASSHRLYADTFQPLDRLESYCRALIYTSGHYASSDSALLRRDYADCRLRVSAKLTDAHSCTVTVTNAEGQPVPDASVLVSIIDGSRPQVEPVELIYGDVGGSGWVDEAVPTAQPTAAGSGLCRDFAFLTCDSEGQAEYSWQVTEQAADNADSSADGSADNVAAAPTGRYLLVQAVAHHLPTADADHTNVVGSDTQEVAVEAGSTVVTLRSARPAALLPETEDEPATRYRLTYTDLAELEDSFSGEGESSLLLVSSPRCSEVLRQVGRLLELDSPLAQAAGLTLMQELGGDAADLLLAPLTRQQENRLSACQQENGSLLFDLRSTAAAALIGDPGLSAHTLRLYCQRVLATRPPGADYAAALAAVAAAGQPQLNEARLLLGREDMDAVSRCWLVIAEAVSGDAEAVRDLPPAPALSAAAEEWALYSLAAACCGDFDRALSALERAWAVPDGSDGSDEQTAGSALPQQRTVLLSAAALHRLLSDGAGLAEGREEEYDLTCRINGEEFRTSFAPDALFRLPLADFDGELQIVNTEGGCDLFTLSEEE